VSPCLLRLRQLEVGRLEVPSDPMARGLTPPDVAVHRGKETQEIDC